MTETTFKVRLDELQTVRIVCQCGGVTELPQEKLASIDTVTQCPVCHRAFIAQQTNPTIFSELHALLDRLSRQSFKIEFPIKIEPTGK